jgi:hypothetical protein
VCIGVAVSLWVPAAADLSTGLSIIVHDTPNNGMMGDLGNLRGGLTSGPRILCADLRVPMQFSGGFEQLPSFTSTTYTGVAGFANVYVRDGTGPVLESRARFNGNNLGANDFDLHLHSLPCSRRSGGPHYQDPAVVDGVENAINENWPFATCVNSYCLGFARNMWVPTPTTLNVGMSIIIHDTPSVSTGSGPRAFCADIEGPRTYTGRFFQLASFDSVAYSDTTLAPSSAQLVVHANRIEATVTFMGSASQVGGMTFDAHLHASRCGEGSPHYQDPDGDGLVNSVNENWPTVNCDATGACTGFASNYWAPTDAALAHGLSIIIHDTPAARAAGASGSGSRWLCADLMLDQDQVFFDLVGNFAQLPAYTGLGYGSPVGTANLRFFGDAFRTQITFYDGDGMENQNFDAHLHADSCALNTATHYQNPANPGIADAVNENWPFLNCDASGSCAGSATSSWGVISADVNRGLSIIVHDTPRADSGSGQRMFCADLVRVQRYNGNAMPLASFGATPRYTTGLMGAQGSAILAVTANTTTATVLFNGPFDVLGGLTFNTHLHATPCSEDEGGVHYQNPTACAPNGVQTGIATCANAINENWPTVTCDFNGTCIGSATTLWVPTATDLAAGLSIIIHDTPNAAAANALPDGARALCIDLTQTFTPVRNAPFVQLASFTSTDYDGSTGTADLQVLPNAIQSTVAFQGISSRVGGRTFNAHVHVGTCSDTTSPHYQNPFGNGLADSMNENWPFLTCDTSGTCSGMATNTWGSTLSMPLSVVIHDTPNAMNGAAGERAFCADLTTQSVTNSPTAAAPGTVPTAAPTSAAPTAPADGVVVDGARQSTSHLLCSLSLLAFMSQMRA